MNELLQRLDAWLSTNRAAYYANLRPGASDEALATFEAFLGFELPADLKMLYKWKNGQLATFPEPLYDSRTFMQLEEIPYAIQPNNELLDMGEFTAANWWSRHWIPFLTDGNSSYLCMDLAGDFDGQAGQLILFKEESPVRSIEFPDLSTFLAGLLEAFETAARAETIPPVDIVYPPGYPLAKRAV